MSSKRKDHLKALFSGEVPSPAPNPATDPAADRAPDRPAPETKAATPEQLAAGRAAAPSSEMAPRAASGAVKAMGLSLSGMNRELDEARALKESFARAEQVIEIDPVLIDPSIVRDRLSSEENGDEAFAELVESFKADGQQVPVLLRPHPEIEGRYQTAYGHRRVRAAARLERPVKAIVRPLSDDELVLAQGKENTERRNLSFIERAFFAQALLERGFERPVVERALSLHKAEMTRLLQVAGTVPPHIARVIGPAPKAGRPRWMALAGFLRRSNANVIASEVVKSQAFRAKTSDERFAELFRRLSNRDPEVQRTRAARQPRTLKDEAGRVIATLSTGVRPALVFDETARPGFAAFVAGELAGLAARFETRAEEPGNGDDKSGRSPG